MKAHHWLRLGVTLAVGGLFAVAPACALAAPDAAQPTGASPPPAATAPAVTPAGAAATVTEVYVTARKRTERLIDAPVAISEISPQTLSKYVANDLTQLSQQVPSLNLQLVSSGQGGTIAIHGVGAGIDPGISQAVSINFDGVQVSDARFLRAEMFDMQDVEVLKGPQALFFGKNSPAGVVALTTKSPGSTFDGYITAGGSPEYGKEYVEGAVTIPVNDTLDVRLAGRIDHENGFLTNQGGPIVNPFECVPNPTGPCVNAISPGNEQGSTVQAYNLFAGRATIIWRPNDAFTATLKASYTDYRDNGDVGNDQRVCPGAHPVESQAGVTAVLTNSDCKLNLTTSLGSWIPTIAATWPDQEDGGKPFSHFNPGMGSLNLSYKAGNFTFTSLTGVVSYAAITQGNSDVGDFNVLGGENSLVGKQYSEEFRVNSNFDGPLQFLAGAYVEYATQTYLNSGMVFPESSAYVQNLGDGYGYDPRNHFAVDWVQHTPETDKTYSGFGQLTWKITDQFTLDGGVRYINETKAATVENVFVNETIIAPVRNAVFLPQGDALTASVPASNFSPEATLSYKPTTNMTFYVAYKSGFQSGGVSNPGLPPPLTSAQALVFQPEVAHGEEGGYKFELFGRTVAGDLTIYNYNFTNLQVQSAREVEPTPGVETVLYTVTNAASAYTRGVEFEGNWVTPLTGFGVNWFINYNVAKYGSYPDAPCYEFQTTALGCVSINGTTGVSLTGQTLPNAPTWAGRLGFTYDHALFNGLSYGLSLDVNYKSSYYLNRPADAFDNIPSACLQGDRLCDLWLVDASARIYTDDGRWEFGVVGKNLGNVLYPIQDGTALGALAGNQQSVAIGDPLEILIELTYHFH